MLGHLTGITAARSLLEPRAARRRRRRVCAAAAAAAEKEPDERFLAEVVYALLTAHSVGAPAREVLPKFQARMSADSYTSVLVALSRKELWEPAAAVARWCREHGVLLPAASYVLVAQRRREEGHWDEALEALSWLRDLGCEPSGQAVEALVQLASEGELRLTRRPLLRELVAWVRSRDAGRALWHVYAPTASAGSDAKASWRSSGLTFEEGGSADELLRGPLDVLKDRLTFQEEQQPKAPPQAPPPVTPPAAPDARVSIDALVRRTQERP